MAMNSSVGDTLDYHVMKIQTFAGGGGSSTNLFRVKGVVEIIHIYGIVITILNANVDNLSLDLFPTGGAPVALATLVDSATAPVGSMFIKATDATDALILKSAVVPFIQENASFREPTIQTICGAQSDGTATYIRATYSGVATNGAIQWMVDWRDVSVNGLVEAA